MFNTEKKNTILHPIILGSTVFLALSVVLLLITSFILTMTDDPRTYVLPTALSILYLSSMAGGSVCQKNSGRIISSAICGLIITGIIFAVSLLIPDSSTIGVGLKVLFFAGIEISFLLGGAAIMYLDSKGGRKHKRKKRGRR